MLTALAHSTDSANVEAGLNINRNRLPGLTDADNAGWLRQQQSYEEVKGGANVAIGLAGSLLLGTTSKGVTSANAVNVEKTAMDGLTAKWGHLSPEKRIVLRKQKVESNAQAVLGRWEKDASVEHEKISPRPLNPHSVDKHGSDIPLQPNLERRSVNGDHPRSGAPSRFGRGEHSSKFNDFRTQLEVMNDANTRELRGLPRFDGVDRNGSPFVVGRNSDGVGYGFSPNRFAPEIPLFNSKLDGWVVRFDKKSLLPYTAYPTK